MSRKSNGPRSVFSSSDYSLGDILQKGPTWLSAGSATFNSVSAKLTQRVREEVAEEQRRRAEATTLVIPYAVDTDGLSALQTAYPEFTLHGIPLWSGVHAGYEAERMVATSLCMERLAAYANKIVALGNAVLPAAMLRMRRVHVEMSPHDPYAVHANHTAQWIYHRMAAQSQNLLRDYGFAIDAAAYRDFLFGKEYQVCDNPTACDVKGGAYFADLSMNPMSVQQVCAGMMSGGCPIGEVIIPYSPDMLIHSRGELGATGIEYELTPDDLLLKYPEGVTGATRYPLGAWIEWLRSGGATVRGGDADYHYQVELTSVRGAYLFASITRLDAPRPQGALSFRTHALELPQQSERYFVRTFRLKSLQLDPTKASSYEPHCYMPDKRLADKVFAHALALPKEAFKDGTVMKRVTVLDGRVTFAGMSVKIDRPVSMDEVAQMTHDIVLRAFVARYNMGELGADLMEQLNAVRDFASAGVLLKVAYLACALAKCAWSWTGGVLADALRSVVEAGLRWIVGRDKTHVPEFSPAPTFVAFETYTRWLSNSVYSRVPDYTGGNVLVPYLRGSREAYRAVNRYVAPKRPVLPGVQPPDINVSAHGLTDDVVDTRSPEPVTQQAKDLVSAMRELNGFSESPSSRFDVHMVKIVDQGPFDYGPEDYVYDEGYVNTINQEHELAFPGLALQQFEADAVSLHQDPQARTMEANHMRFPAVGQKPVSSVEVYKSKCTTYRVEKKMQTLQQLILALDARNLSAPQIAEPSNVDAVVVDTWENFLDMCCVPGARDLVAEYKADRVGLEKEAFEEWTKKANPNKIKSMLADLESAAMAVEEYDISLFDVMVKSDAKPPLSTKPLKEQLAPQVIVYHKSVLSAVYSSIYRVMAGRFLSLLKPEWKVILRDDDEAVRQHFTHYYPWGDDKPEFLENDYSKYDKSQSEVCVRLEQFVCEQLGFASDMLAEWFEGHSRSRIHSMQHALTLTIDWQRRSGGSNTSFGNVLVNILTTAYVYRGSTVIAAVYIGDDSLIMCKRVSASEQSVRILGDRYNLQAKFLVPQYPYFASNFVVFDEFQRQALFVPDPYKRAERIGLSVNAVDPNWDDRIRSHHENCHKYKFRKVQVLLEPALASRYELSDQCNPRALLNALATSAASRANTRALYEDATSVIQI